MKTMTVQQVLKEIMVIADKSSGKSEVYVVISRFKDKHFHTCPFCGREVWKEDFCEDFWRCLDCKDWIVRELSEGRDPEEE